MVTSMPGKLSSICCQRNPDPAAQRKEMEAALEAGANVHETDKNGVTPLHHAVRFRNTAAVRVLLEHGARVNQACKRSQSTALHRAVTSTGAPETAGKTREALEIIRLLLDAGADASLVNKSGKRPIDYVKQPEILQLLQTRSQPANESAAVK